MGAREEALLPRLPKGLRLEEGRKPAGHRVGNCDRVPGRSVQEGHTPRLQQLGNLLGKSYPPLTAAPGRDEGAVQQTILKTNANGTAWPGSTLASRVVCRPGARCQMFKITRFQLIGTALLGCPIPPLPATPRRTRATGKSSVEARALSQEGRLVDDPQPGAIDLAACYFCSGATREPGRGERQILVAHCGTDFPCALWPGG